uniref:Ribosomal protein S11 n=1 Tax=Storeatula sp. CCMP1868 TaxID=195070 RepID=A0A2P1G875_9CRYP|nr:ribosomal protein S11 [Storeatula sp. CCMP1868]AVM81152.1 ribosomal protein S11 [Storeatula sp. CCMP1868]
MVTKNKFGIVYVNNNTNNTIVTISTLDKKVICNGGTGKLGLKKSKRSNSFAAQNLTLFLCLKAYKKEIKFVQVIFKGFVKYRDMILKGVLFSRLKIVSIKDFTRISFNGCKMKKKRRF